MKYLLYVVFIIILATLGYGYYIKSDQELLGHQLIGISVISLFIVWMPLFIYHRYKNRDLKKYMITDDFFEKIKNEADTFIDKK